MMREAAPADSVGDVPLTKDGWRCAQHQNLVPDNTMSTVHGDSSL